MNINNVKFEASFGTAAQLRPSSHPEIVFSGKSNVGKSSLINKFFNRKNLARVSGVPGKTTTINFFTVDDVRIADLPGYGYAKRPDAERRRWGELMEAYFASERNIKLIVQLLDMRHEPTEDDKTMLGFLAEAGYPFVCVLTKCDKLNKTERENRRKAFSENEYLSSAIKIIEASAQNGEGLGELKDIIEKSLEDGFPEISSQENTASVKAEADEPAINEPAAPVRRAVAVKKRIKK